jgi:hypothetical protein
MELVPLPAWADSPLVTRDQEKLIKRQEKYLKVYAGLIQKEIKGARTTAALVIIQHLDDKPPVVLPSDDPVTAAANNMDTVASAEGCIFVFRNDIALMPQPYSCVLLRDRANESRALHDKGVQQDAAFVALQNSIDMIKSQTVALEESLRANTQALKANEESLKKNEGLIATGEETLAKDEEAIKKQEATIAKHEQSLGNARQSLKRIENDNKSSQTTLGMTMKVVSFHQAELHNLEGSLQQLEKSYRAGINMMQKNNEQIDSIIANLNKSFNEVQQRLNEMNQRLDAIK